MTNRTFLTLHGSIYLIFALALFVLPEVIWPLYGVEINDHYAHFLSQHTSIFLGGIGFITLMLKDIEPSKTAYKLLLALAMTNGLGVIITTYAGVSGIFTGFGWSDPLFFASLTTMSYIQLKKSKSGH